MPSSTLSASSNWTRQKETRSIARARAPERATLTFSSAARLLAEGLARLREAVRSEVLAAQHEGRAVALHGLALLRILRRARRLSDARSLNRCRRLDLAARKRRARAYLEGLERRGHGQTEAPNDKPERISNSSSESSTVTVKIECPARRV